MYEMHCIVLYCLGNKGKYSGQNSLLLPGPLNSNDLNSSPFFAAFLAQNCVREELLVTKYLKSEENGA